MKSRAILQIPRSAADVLHALFKQGCIRDEWIWIDAICINQADVDEKNMQVASMNEVYSLAKLTAAYVGPFTQSTDLAFRFWAKLDACLETAIAAGRGVLSGDELFMMTNTSPDSLEWRALRAHFAQEWFTRTWVVQEVVLSQNLIFVWGHHSILWKQLKSMVTRERHFHYWGAIHESDFRARQALAMISKFRKLKSNRKRHKGKGWKCGLSFALYETDDCKATDPRDRIFGLLGILHEPSMDFHIVPDYTESVCDVYTEVTAKWTAAADSFDLTYAAGAGYSRSNPTLPSWVPDFVRSMPYYPGSFHRAGKAVNNVDLLPLTFKGNEMFVQVFRIDEIQSLVPFSYLQINTHPFLDAEQNQEIFQTLARSIELRKTIHDRPWPDDLYEHFCRTIVSNEQIHAIDAPAPDRFGVFCQNLSIFKQSNVRLTNCSISITTAADGQSFFETPAAVSHDNAFCMTASEKPGLIPGRSRVGDHVCVAPGSRLPFVIRPEERREMERLSSGL
ncbi:hypothetical protein H2203_007632 [Taxawa tesnikishii (nom. ined.)]|nr:hypothetical protein H2203_007632 [Dothideales sp. JES 119]